MVRRRRLFFFPLSCRPLIPLGQNCNPPSRHQVQDSRGRIPGWNQAASLAWRHKGKEMLISWKGCVKLSPCTIPAKACPEPSSTLAARFLRHCKFSVELLGVPSTPCGLPTAVHVLISPHPIPHLGAAPLPTVAFSLGKVSPAPPL